MLKLQKFELKTKKFVLNFTQKNPQPCAYTFLCTSHRPKTSPFMQ